MLVQLVLTLGLALLVSALTVHFRDCKDLLGNLLTLWFFATPIIYPMQQAPENLRWALNLNPMTHLAISYQEVLFYVGPHGHWRWLVALASMSIVVFLAGYFVFDRLRDRSRRKCEMTPAIDVVNVSRSTGASRARSSSRR